MPGSTKKQLETLKNNSSESNRLPFKSTHEVPIKVTLVLILSAMASCAFGVFRGETLTVLMKAINICMECIGLG